ncbi:DUF3853 family protein [Riemerella anatipestifer]|uniref:DUF3853 family protein n=1 Tax=Riemerella anatipestifer TaxID=34085 RepID=UPI00069A7909|nr:DUF3853 family protein [Riemerella anatipestifer]MDR7694134.1 DUF3853 family protein [Riemerella anatipestifer]MDY3528894.1 DUF3853 family protein [Riemerella anatipestifer]MDY3538266.1 DUF3853 family protein [Riemerella anatipestifer]
MKINPNTQLLKLTVAEYIELHNTMNGKKNENKEYVYGLKGLAKILGCSRTTASKIKNSGIIDEAISQVGKLIVIDKKKVLEITAKEKKL